MSQPNKQFRQIEVEEIEYRSDDASGESVVEGVGIVYDRKVELWPGYFETIRSGAFDGSIGKREVKSFFNHNPNFVLSHTKSKPPLVLDDGPSGLRFKSPIPDTSYGRDLVENLKRRNVRGASFSFSIARDGDIVTRDEKGNIHREVVKGELYEIGPVTNPAYKATTAKVGARTAESAYQELVERFEREDSEAEQERAAVAAIEAANEERKRYLEMQELLSTIN